MPLSESFQLRLTQPQMARIDECVRVTGLGRAEHIRRAVDIYLQAFRTQAELARVKAAGEVVATIVNAKIAEPAQKAVSSRQPARIARR